MKKQKPIKVRVSSILRSLLQLPPPWVEKNILNHKFIVREGTIRATPDYDDAWLFSCAMQARRIFDIGANIGQSAFIELYPKSVEHVLLVEPNPTALVIAAENLIRNSLISRVNLDNACISDTSGIDIELHTVQFGAAGSIYSSHAQTAKKLHSHITVKTKTIDDLVEHWGTPDFIKIDIEGAELFALRGAINCLKEHQTRVLVEMHSNEFLPMIENARGVLELCSQVGYKVWYLSRHKEIVSHVDLAGRGRCHLLLQPINWDWPEKIIRINQSAQIDQALFDMVTQNVPYSEISN